jgi:4-hydroxy-3-polyprenylbenzoate decarboxylase
MKKKFIVAITGASGSIYGFHLVSALMKYPVELFVLMSDSGRQVAAHETGFKSGSIAEYLEQTGGVFHEQATLNETDPADSFAPVASGSFQHHGMVIAPCSMNTLAAVSNGITSNLIHRAADVCLKEKRALILLARETPLSLIHLKNMTRAAEAGATIMPPSPGFYARPKTIDDLVDSIVARVLDHLHIDNRLSVRWPQA